MTAALRSWTQSHRYHATLRQLRALSPSELRSLGIVPSQIEHLAIEVSRSAIGPVAFGQREASRQ